MPMVQIRRGAEAPKMTRGEVKPGQVFMYAGKKNQYAAVGANGRLYSVNLASGEPSSAPHEKANREVALVGKWEFVHNNKPSPSVVRECRRSEVRAGEVFHVNGKDTLYAHLGTISRDLEGYLSVPLARTENHAVSRNGQSRVNVVGTFTMEAEVTG